MTALRPKNVTIYMATNSNKVKMHTADTSLSQNKERGAGKIPAVLHNFPLMP